MQDEVFKSSRGIGDKAEYHIETLQLPSNNLIKLAELTREHQIRRRGGVADFPFHRFHGLPKGTHILYLRAKWLHEAR